MMVAAIMCGGKGSRMKGFANVEKPLLKLKGKTMVELVLNALLQFKNFSKIVAATSSNTPITNSYLVSNLSDKIDILETQGISYSHDISTVLNTLKPASVFVVTADLPLLRLKDVRQIISKWNPQHPCTSVVSDKRFVANMGINPSITVCINSRQYCQTGISIIDSSKVCGGATMYEHYLIMNQKGVAVNVNTRSDFEIAAKLMSCCG
jgi:GTP:adenosylcobinamide-phosphate guanylyltransferase